MAARRFWYLLALLGCGVFYIAYGEWFSWVALLTVAGLPWLSLILSLPAMLRFHLEPEGPDMVLLGTPARACLMGCSVLPMPPFRGRLRLQDCITGETMAYREGQGLPTEHCGGLVMTVDKARICDYLGLFSFPVKKKGKKTVIVRPVPIPVPTPPDLSRYIARSWRPKFGGGFAENHELRLYRPGDSLNQVHWKLSAKTGKLTIREPMIPERGLVLLTMNLRGSYKELDRKFGRLLWLGTYLTEQSIPFELRVLTGKGVQSFLVASEQELQKSIDSLLCTEGAKEGSIQDRFFPASWQYHIGGGEDEA